MTENEKRILDLGLTVIVAAFILYTEIKKPRQVADSEALKLVK